MNHVVRIPAFFAQDCQDRIAHCTAPTSTGDRNRVTLICFEPLPAFWSAINRIYKSNDWEDILTEPYLLVIMAFEAWYQLVDENAWEVLDLARESGPCMGVAECILARNFETTKQSSPSTASSIQSI